MNMNDEHWGLLYAAFRGRRTPDEIDALYAWVNYDWSVFPLTKETAHTKHRYEDAPPKPDFIPTAPCDDSFRGKLLKRMMYANADWYSIHAVATTTDLNMLIRWSARPYEFPR